jgi:hypothetical protein
MGLKRRWVSFEVEKESGGMRDRCRGILVWRGRSERLMAGTGATSIRYFLAVPRAYTWRVMASINYCLTESQMPEYLRHIYEDSKE